MYARVVDVQATDHFTLILTFSNNERRLFDLKPYLSVGRFAELGRIEIFKQVAISFDTVEWANGLDLDPEFLYAHSHHLADFAQPGEYAR